MFDTAVFVMMRHIVGIVAAGMQSAVLAACRRQMRGSTMPIVTVQSTIVMMSRFMLIVSVSVSVVMVVVMLVFAAMTVVMWFVLVLIVDILLVTVFVIGIVVRVVDIVVTVAIVMWFVMNVRRRAAVEVMLVMSTGCGMSLQGSSVAAMILPCTIAKRTTATAAARCHALVSMRRSVLPIRVIRTVHVSLQCDIVLAFLPADIAMKMLAYLSFPHFYVRVNITPMVMMIVRVIGVIRVVLAFLTDSPALVIGFPFMSSVPLQLSGNFLL